MSLGRTGSTDSANHSNPEYAVSNTKSQKNKGRGFFQQMQPTFSIAPSQSHVVTLQFLDHSDPHKDTVVRKKAREWVNRTKEQSRYNKGLPPSPGSNSSNFSISPGSSRRVSLSPGIKAKKLGKRKDVHVQNMQEIEWMLRRDQLISEKGLEAVGTASIDPFSVLPNVSREYRHIVQFFFTSACPDEVPCSDDKYSNNSLIKSPRFKHDNTVFGNMSEHEASFKLWLYATTTIRDAIFGCNDSEEAQWFYHEALGALQDLVKTESEMGKYSENLLRCLACITGTAVCQDQGMTRNITSRLI